MYLPTLIKPFQSKCGEKLCNLLFFYNYWSLINRRTSFPNSSTWIPWSSKFSTSSISSIVNAFSLLIFYIPTKLFHSWYHSDNSLKVGYSGGFHMLLIRHRCYWGIFLFLISGLFSLIPSCDTLPIITFSFASKSRQSRHKLPCLFRSSSLVGSIIHLVQKSSEFCLPSTCCQFLTSVYFKISAIWFATNFEYVRFARDVVEGKHRISPIFESYDR